MDLRGRNIKYLRGLFLRVGLLCLLFQVVSASAVANVVCSTTATCGGTTLNWQPDSGTTAWNNTNDWVTEAGAHNGTTIPTLNTQSACIHSDWATPNWPENNYSLLCLEVNSGSFVATPAAAQTLTVVGPYFRNLNAGSLTTNANFTVKMNGTAAQTFENVDMINKLIIANPTSVTLTESFSFSNAAGSGMVINAGSGDIFIEGSVILASTAAGDVLTIPASAMVEVKPGGVLQAMAGITVSGVLKIDAGAKLVIGNGKTLQVNSGGLLELSGAPGDIAMMDADQGGGSYTVTVAGAFTANNFSINRMAGAGLNVTGSIQSLANGDFHYLPAGGYGITLASSASGSTSWSAIGFYDDFGNGTSKSINASAYMGSTISVSPYSGIGGPARANDPNGKINWGTPATATLQMTNATASGNPPATIAASSAATLFSTFGFSLTSPSTATNITSIKLTLGGSNSASDVSYGQLFNDTNGNCVYNAGTDTQIGSNFVFTGTPPSATLVIPSGTVSPSGLSQKCVHVLLATSADAQTGDTLSVSMAETADAVNSQGYSWSNAGGPPVNGGVSTITGTAISKWNGGNGPQAAAENWNANTGDWTPTGTPASPTSCQIGVGYSYPRMNANNSCQNVTMPTGGTIDWNNTSNVLTITGSLTLESGYHFVNVPATAVLAFASTSSNQSIDAQTAWPGAVTINNTASGKSITVNNNWSIGGNLTVASGTLVIASGYSLAVGGNIAINSGAILLIQPGATLQFTTNGSTLTVNSGGSLQILGSSSQTAMITSGGTAVGYSIVVNGAISAQHYAINNMGAAGMTIAAGATIDPANYLLNGSFTYPIGSNPTLLTLDRQIPGNALTNMIFDKGGSSATGTVSAIKTSAAAGTLQISNYSGSLTNCCTTAPVYTVSWVSPTSTLKLTKQTSGPASVNQGSTSQFVGSWGFQQTQAGAFSTTDLNTINVTLTGTGTASDVSAARLYYDPTCSGSGGTQIGAIQTFSGAPPVASFSGFGTLAPVQASTTSPPLRCVYLLYDISSSATSGDTIGAEIHLASDATNSQNYQFNGSYAPPVTLGSPASINGNTIAWTGATSTAWNTTSNWNLNRLPTSSDDCAINSAPNNPIISAAGAICKSVFIGNGNLTINTGSNLDVYGAFSNTGTFTQNGTATITIRDSGTPTSQSITSSGAIGSLTFNKTSGGSVVLGGSTLTINQLSIPSGQNFTFLLSSGNVLTLPNGMTMASGTMSLSGGSEILMGTGKQISVTGGTFLISGTNANYPTQTTTLSGVIAPLSSGPWGFSATSGNMDLTGFVFDTIDVNGLNLSGNVNLLHLDGGQLIHLSQSYTSVKALQFNTTGSVLSATGGTSNNFGWSWGGLNSYWSLPPTSATPSAATSYLLASSTGCSGQSITFMNWFGDFYSDINTPDPQTKVSATNCTITINTNPDSPVSLISFSATPYQNAVVLDWVTGLEWQHQGFNVYRSISPNSGYAEINSGLIVNMIATGTVHGTYQFYDTSVIPGVMYYYQISDLATNGTETMHGPVSAQPDSSFALAPAPDVSAIVANNQEPSPTSTYAPPAANPATPGITSIAPGVTLLAKTNNTMRVEIDVPPFTTAAAQVAPYVTVAIPGYSSTNTAGLPQLPQQKIMLNVPGAATATSTIVSTQQTTFNSIDIASAPLWSVSNGALVPSWSLNSSFYSTDQSLPSSPITLGNLTQSQGSMYLPLIVVPLSYDPVQDTIVSTTQIIVDITLNGAATWNAGAALPSSGPWGAEGGLRVTISSSGVYQLGYSDLVAAEVDGPFQNVDVTKLRLFYGTQEIPIQVTSATGYFSPGDSLVFYTPFNGTYETNTNDLILVVDPATTGLRMTTNTADPTGLSAGRSSVGFLHTVSVEQNVFGFFHEPYGENLDHVLWAEFYAPVVNPGDNILASTAVLPSLLRTQPVEIQAYVKGSTTASTANPLHHLQVVVNGVVGGDQYIPIQTPTMADFVVNGSLFQPGLNQISFVAVGDMTNGDYDIMTMDRYSVIYSHSWWADTDQVDGVSYAQGQVLTFDGFTGNDIVAFDVTNPYQTTALSNGAINASSASTYSIQLASQPAANSGQEFFVTRLGAIPTPDALELNSGSKLHSSANGADAIFIGTSDLLSAAAPLVGLRQSQGFRVSAVDIDDVFAEFGNGVAGAQALKSFIQYTATNWAPPAPRYIVLVGDGTYDPRNSLGLGVEDTLPLHLLVGAWEDFGSDNWFVAFNPSDTLPDLAIGRIPGRTPALIQTYVNKVLNYESGAARPGTATSASMTIIADVDQDGGENFAPRAQALAQSIQTADSAIQVSTVFRAPLTDQQFNQAIIGAFNSGSTIVHYLGHGAENMWAASDVFMNSDASSLTNVKLPVVISMDCLNGYFYDADPSYQSLSDSLLFNPNGGAIAVWASPSLTDPGSQGPYQTALYNIITSTPGIALGDAVRLAKVQGGWSAQTAEVVNSWTLIGDPMLRMNLPMSPTQGASTAAPQQVTSNPNGSSSSSGGGFLACGMISAAGRSDDGGRSSGPGNGAAGEFVLLAAIVWLSRRMNSMLL